MRPFEGVADSVFGDEAVEDGVAVVGVELVDEHDDQADRADGRGTEAVSGCHQHPL